MTSEDLAEVMPAVDRPTPSLQKIVKRRRGSEKADLAGPPLPAVRGVASAFVAQDSYDYSGR